MAMRWIVEILKIPTSKKTQGIYSESQFSSKPPLRLSHCTWEALWTKVDQNFTYLATWLILFSTFKVSIWYNVVSSKSFGLEWHLTTPSLFSMALMLTRIANHVMVVQAPWHSSKDKRHCWKTCHDKASFSRFFSISPEGKQAPFLWSTWKTWNKTCHHCDFVSTVPLPWRSLTSSAHRWRAAPQIGYQCFNLWNQMTRGFLRFAVYHFDWKNQKKSVPCAQSQYSCVHCWNPVKNDHWKFCNYNIGNKANVLRRGRHSHDSQARLKTVPKAEDPAQSISIPRMTSETNFKEIMNTTFLNAFQRYILRKRPWPGSPVTSDPDPKLKIL